MDLTEKCSVLFNAAQLADADLNLPSCGAIYQATPIGEIESAIQLTIWYSRLFSPNCESRGHVWGQAWGKDRKQCRVLALLFAYHMHMQGDA